ncbi:hypothetical protein [Endozoicomonas sp. 4G]|uniref:hypothetical protein n=1 Tax=Endozoicomonas sp. 4G TaxID=2872754 RepID=UPI002078DDFC|nr:hypothetical protein [Endozoicomonas sp. 4G]
MLLSSAPSVSPVPGKKSESKHYINGPITLKNGHEIIGAPDDGFEIVIEDRVTFYGEEMIKIGKQNSFTFPEIRDSRIKLITFKPMNACGGGLNSIIDAKCFNRKLIVEDNKFIFHQREAVLLLVCSQSIQPIKGFAFTGPILKFTNNVITSETFIFTDGIRRVFLPETVLLVNLPNVKGESDTLHFSGNTLSGKLARIFHKLPRISRRTLSL